MKVAHIDEQTGWRGGEQQASWLMRGLAARGHGVLAMGRPGAPFLQNSHADAPLRRVPLPLRGEWDLPSAARLAALVRREGIDILHAHTSHAHTLAVLARAWAGRGRVVVSRRVSFSPRNHVLNRWKYRAPDRLLAVSQRVGAVLAEFGVSRENIDVVHSAVDLERLRVPPLSRASLGVDEDAPLVVSAGALVGHKDHENLVDAAARVHKEFPRLRVVIAGEGPLRGALETRIAEAGLSEAVTLLGHRDDAPALLRAADVYVSSSWSEGLGTSVLEALACGTPVVATEAGGAAEMVVPGETGLLVPVRDAAALAQAMVVSLRDREAAYSRAEAGKALVQREFTVERMVERTLAVYDAVLSPGAAAR